MLLSPYMYRRAKDQRTRTGRPYFLKAVDAGYVAAVNKFIAVGTSVNMRHAENQFPTAIHSCVHRGDVATAQLLTQNGVDLSVTNNMGETPLYYAVGRKNPSEEMVRVLLDGGSDILATSENMRTILCVAAKSGSASILQLLLDRGALAVTIAPDMPTPLHCAAKDGSAATIQLLLEAGSNIEATDGYGVTPLYGAIHSCKMDNLKVLLQWGANLHTTDSFGRTPLHVVISTRQNAATAHRIIHQVTLPGTGCLKAGETGVSLCRFAESSDPILDLLLDAGADIRATNKHGKSPLQWAEAYVIRATGTQ
jgi:ankyrin repeat protein